MEGRVFRFQNYTKKYEETCDFYERTLKLPIITKRETAYEDRVRVYKLGSGQIEVIYLPDDMDAPVSNGWTLQVEVENADKVFEEAQAAADTYLYNVKRMADAKNNIDNKT